METKNLTLSLPKRVWEILEIDFAGLGDTEAETNSKYCHIFIVKQRLLCAF